MIGIFLFTNVFTMKKNFFSRVPLYRKILCAFFSLIFIVSLSLFVFYTVQNEKGNTLYSDLKKDLFSGELSPVDRAKELFPFESVSNSDPLLSEYSAILDKTSEAISSLKEENSDIFGWLTVSGTNIDYPAVRGDDNSFYLNHSYTGEYLSIGSVFADYRCSDPSDDRNTVFYAHNIKNGAMFHDVEKFFDKDFLNKQFIMLSTETALYIYKPFSVYESRSNYGYFKTSFAQADEFVSFAEEVAGNTEIIPTDTSVSFFGEKDRIITLSTCTNLSFGKRYVLHAKLIMTVQK